MLGNDRGLVTGTVEKRVVTNAYAALHDHPKRANL